MKKMRMEPPREDHWDALPMYFIASGMRGPLYRIAPCLSAAVGKLEAVKQCCGMVLDELDEYSTEGELMVGSVSIINDMKSDLYESISVLRYSLSDLESTDEDEPSEPD